MTEAQETQEPQGPQTVDEKLDALLDVVVSNNQMLQALVNAVNAAMQTEQAPQQQAPPQQAPAMPYQPGYPPPENQYGNVYGDGREYSSADEQYRGPRTFNSLPDVNTPHNPSPVPPGGMPQGQPPQPSPPPVGPSGERVMTPDEYRSAQPE